MPLPNSSLRRPTLLIVGCGDIGLRVLRQLGGRVRALALSSDPGRRPLLRAAGAVPLIGNLDDPSSLGRLAALADWVLHLAPPPGEGDGDSRTAALLRALARSPRVRRIVYASTSGVYGDAQGARFDETRTLRPATALLPTIRQSPRRTRAASNTWARMSAFFHPAATMVSRCCLAMTSA